MTTPKTSAIGFAASASHLTLAYLAASGAQAPLLTLAVSGESFASGLGYDGFGRLRKVANPHPAGVDALSVDRDFDAFGNVIAVRDHEMVDRHHAFAGNAQALTAGGQHHDVGARGEHRAHQIGRRAEHVFAVVEYEEEAPLA